jgi:hypothetical protein
MSLAQRVADLRGIASSEKLASDLLQVARFTRKDVSAVTSVADHQLHNWVARKWLTLSGEQSPGKGRRRLFTGSDALTIAFGLELQPFGLMQVADLLSRTQQVPKRAYRMLLDPAFTCGRAIAIVPSPEGDGWLYVPYGPGTAQLGHDFRAAVIVDVDRLILETLERLLTVLQSGKPATTPAGYDIRVQRWSGDLLDEDFGDDYLIVSTMPLTP